MSHIILSRDFAFVLLFISAMHSLSHHIVIVVNS